MARTAQARRLMNTDLYLGFCLTALAILITPGPIVTLVISNSLKHGTMAGLRTVAGSQFGSAIWLLITAFGLASIVLALGPWFLVLRLIGAAYLIWIGIKLLTIHDNPTTSGKEKRSRDFFLQGLLMNLSSPKSLLLFGALIPQFISKDAPYLRQTIILGITFILLAAVNDSIYALAASKAGLWLSEHTRIIQSISGVCLITVGTWISLI
jgi:threonine/homoserine/homoserine lactone efflux protein